MGSESVNLFTVVQELQKIVAEADEKRMSVWFEQFESEYPDLAEEIRYCALMPEPKLVLNYLAIRDTRFALLKLVPNIEPTISFLQRFIRERSNPDENTSAGVIAALPPAPTRRRRIT